MLKAIFPSQLALGAAQAALCATVALLVAWIARRREIRVERETAVALARGLAQIVAVGSVLVLLLRGPQWTSVFVLAGMTVAAAATSARRARGIPGAFAVSLYSIGAGAGLLIVVMTLAGVIDAGIASLVPMGSMLIANAMNTNSLALNRFRAEVEAHAGLIETGVALGAAAPETGLPQRPAAYHGRLIPAHRLAASPGVGGVSGLIAGKFVLGARPLYA